LCLLTPYV
jgi:hypothetical protein